VFDGVICELGAGGARICGRMPFDRGQLVQVEFVRPSRKNTGVGRRLTAVGKIVWRRKAARHEANGGRNSVFELGIEFVALDRCIIEWVDEAIASASVRENGG